MAYYNLFRIIKSLFFRMCRPFKYLLMGFICILFISVCLLLINNKSIAITLKTFTYNGQTYTSYIPDACYNTFITLNEYKSNDYDYFAWVDSGKMKVQFFPKDTGKFYIVPNSSNYASLNGTTTSYSNVCRYYEIGENNGVVSISTSAFLPYSTRQVWHAGGTTYWFTSSITVYDSSSYTNPFYYVAPPFVAPALYPNASTEQSEQNALTSGNFTFFIVEPGSISDEQDILLQFYNTTNTDSQSNVVQTIVLNKHSPFYEETANSFEYVITARFLSWFQVVNGQSYKARLSWINPSNPLDSQYIDYNWTMSLTAEQQQIEEQKTQQEINQGINNLNNSINDLNNTQQETNNFLTDDSYDSSIFELPSVTIDVTSDDYINSLFGLIRDAFLSENSVDFEFVVPFSNEKITIPANYIEEHLPEIIVNIIRMFYWYFISRFILKDILKSVDSLRQGDFFLSSENDIKTEVL